MVEYDEQIEASITAILSSRGAVSVDELGTYGAENAHDFLQRYALDHQYDMPLVFDGLTLRLRGAAPTAASAAPAQPAATAESATVAGAPATGPTYAAPAPAGADPVPQPTPYTDAAPAAPPAYGSAGDTFAAGTPGVAAYDYKPASAVDIALNAGPSKLDTKRSEGAVGIWAWLLPTGLLLPGGIVAWLLFRNTNRRIANWLFWTGVACTVLTVASLPFMGPIMKQTGMASELPGTPSGPSAWPASVSGLPTLFFFGSASSSESQKMAAEINGIQGLYDGKLEFDLYGDVPANPDDAAFAKAHGVTKYPTTVIVGGDSKEQQRWSGVVPVDQLQKAMDGAGP